MNILKHRGFLKADLYQAVLIRVYVALFSSWQVPNRGLDWSGSEVCDGFMKCLLIETFAHHHSHHCTRLLVAFLSSIFRMFMDTQLPCGEVYLVLLIDTH